MVAGRRHSADDLASRATLVRRLQRDVQTQHGRQQVQRRRGHERQRRGDQSGQVNEFFLRAFSVFQKTCRDSNRWT